MVVVVLWIEKTLRVSACSMTFVELEPAMDPLDSAFAAHLRHLSRSCSKSKTIIKFLRNDFIFTRQYV